ncbi:MAG: CYTH domain-containing protein [Pseudomonadota bacterium]|nr:CYTH domain-containing protein [Pseudomonadota bacterium]
MAIEIERKYLVSSMAWKAQADAGARLLQGYMANTQKVTIRVRIAGEQAWLTLKSASAGIRRKEFECSLPVADAKQILDEFCLGQVIHKTRYRLPLGGHVWEIDVFHDANEGLVLAEIELKNEQENFTLPAWIGQEVSADKRYYNAYLSQTPYSAWPKQ